MIMLSFQVALGLLGFGAVMMVALLTGDAMQYRSWPAATATLIASICLQGFLAIITILAVLKLPSL